MKRNWTLLPAVPEGIAAELGFSRMGSQLLYNRGITSRVAAQSFLAPSSSDSHDPWLLPDMDVAVQRLTRAIAGRELIGVFGDFDIDGISGTAVMTTALRNLGADVVSYIPDRQSEGHGLSPDAVRSMARRGVSVMVTVDCGPTSEAGNGQAAPLDIDMIITDHHVVPQGPPYPFTALVNPKRPDSEYPFEHLTGAGTAYKTVQALYDSEGLDAPTDLLDLAALGTIGDVGPLIGENRYLVSEGIRQMNAARRPGLSALAAVAGLADQDFDAGSLSFQIIPRLNAPGRLADAGISLDLLTTTDLAQAESMASQLDRLNALRKTATAAGVKQADDQIRRRWGDSPPGVIMVGRRDWSQGIVGLIASRITDTHARPAIAVAVGEHESRASARSVSDCDILEVIERSSHLFTQFGGHAQAAGFTIPNEKLPELAEAFESLPGNWAGGAAEREVTIDLTATPSIVKRDLFSFTDQMAPYGEGNPKPVFASPALQVLESRRVGSGEHLKLRLSDEIETWDAIGFRLGHRISDAKRGSAIDVAYQMERNTWNGRTSLQLVIEDLATSQS